MSFSTKRSPLPPPPAAAFTMIGNPIFFAIAATSASVSNVPGDPGTTGTPAADINLRAATLSPICSIASGGGPIQVRPARCTARANAARSEKKP